MQLLSVLLESEEEIKTRSKAVESHWSPDKYQDKSSGEKILLNALAVMMSSIYIVHLTCTCTHIQCNAAATCTCCLEEQVLVLAILVHNYDTCVEALRLRLSNFHTNHVAW